MWLHVIKDGKFTDGLIDMFESAAPGQHIYAVFRPKAVPAQAQCVAIDGLGDFRALLASRSDWRGVIFNPLMPKTWRWLPHIPRPLRVIWYGWGYESYRTWPTLASRYLYQQKTRAWLYRNDTLSTRLQRGFSGLQHRYRGWRNLGRVDEFVSLVHHNYPVFRQAGLLRANTRYRPGMVGTAFSVRHMPERVTPGNDILLGNSADPANNHLEAIDWLAQMELGNRNVIVPLSYGDGEYREMIVAYGRARLGERFRPVVDYMPLEDYKALLSRCGIMLSNSLRPLGFGNMLIMLMQGAKVIMNDTPAYRALADWGVTVALRASEPADSLLEPLAPVQVESNRSAVYEHVNRARMQSELRTLLQAADSTNSTTASDAGG